MSRRGSILVLTLVLILVTAAALTKFSERAMNELAGEGYYVQRDRLRSDACSALEVTLAVLNDFRQIDGGLFAPAQGWSDPLTFANYEPREGVEVTVEFSDENARIPLGAILQNDLPLVSLLTELEFEPKTIEVITDSLSDWIDADESTRPYGAESNEYANLEIPHRSANRVPRNFEELESVQGFADLFFDAERQPNNAFALLKNRFSLYGAGKINLNTASEEVLRLTGDFDDASLSGITHARQTQVTERESSVGKYFTSVEELANAAGLTLQAGERYTMKTETLGIIITVREDQASYRLKAIATMQTLTPTMTAREAARRELEPPIALEYPFTFQEIIEDPPPTSARY